MGTRSRIGLQLADDSILSVYCHFDGYPEFNGVKLVENFNSYEKAAGWNNETLPVTGPLTYASRGEDCPPRYDVSAKTYLENGEEYAYLFANGEWVCYSLNDGINQVNIPVPVAA